MIAIKNTLSFKDKYYVKLAYDLITLIKRRFGVVYNGPVPKEKRFVYAGVLCDGNPISILLAYILYHRLDLAEIGLDDARIDSAATCLHHIFEYNMVWDKTKKNYRYMSKSYKITVPVKGDLIRYVNQRHQKSWLQRNDFSARELKLAVHRILYDYDPSRGDRWRDNYRLKRREQQRQARKSKRVKQGRLI